MTWNECLLTEAKKIIRNYKGKLELHITERLEYISVSILAGKRYDFELKKNEIEEED